MPPRLKAVLMNEHDRFILQRMLDEAKRGVRNTRNRARTEHSFVDGVDAQAVDHYIAYVEGTIPALVGEDVGTGTGSVAGPGGAVPGSALCPIYKVVNGVLIAAGFQKRVYNITASDISSTWVSITKDKFGTWTANLGGSTTILVEITEGVTGTGTLGTGTVLGDPVAIYRTSHPTGFDVTALDENHDQVGGAFRCYADELVNVHYTGSVVRIQRFGAKWQIVTTGENNWEDGLTVDAIDVDESVGTAPETQGRVQLFSEGPVVYAGTSFPIGSLIFCQVRFDSQAQKFRIGDQACDTNSGAVGT